MQVLDGTCGLAEVCQDILDDLSTVFNHFLAGKTRTKRREKKLIQHGTSYGMEV